MVKALLLCVAEADFIPEEVYVVVTVSVTPVGNVVILGVGVPSFDGDTDLETVAEEHREARCDGLDETDFVIQPEGVRLFDIRLLRVCLALDETVVEDDCDLLTLAEGVYDTEALGVFELLVEPETVAESALLLDDLGLNVEDGVAVSAGDPVGLSVSFALGPVVAEPDATAEELLLSTTVAVIVLVLRSVKDTLPDLDDEAETLPVFVCVLDLVVDTEMMGVRVSLIDAVPHVDALDVFEGGAVLVIVVEPERVLVACVLCVAVLVGRVELLPVTLAVEVLELETLRDPLGDPVEVFDDDTDCVAVADTSAVPDAFVVFVNDGDAEEVFDEAIVLVLDTLAVLVLEACAVLVVHGLLEAVFELETVLVVVFVGATERVEVVDPVVVLDAAADSVPRDVDDVVFETVLLRVVVCVDVTVFVEVLLIVLGSVGLVDFVPVVVRVDVLDCVGDFDGNTLFITRCLTSTLS